MLEMSSSAGRLLLSGSGSYNSTPIEAHSHSLVGVIIPAPLILPTPAAGISSVTLDTNLGLVRVCSQLTDAAPQVTHLMGRFSAAQTQVGISFWSAAAAPKTSKHIWGSADRVKDAKISTAAAVAVIEYTSGLQSEQYIIHPAVIDSCTQLVMPSAARPPLQELEQHDSRNIVQVSTMRTRERHQYSYHYIINTSSSKVRLSFLVFVG